LDVRVHLAVRVAGASKVDDFDGTAAALLQQHIFLEGEFRLSFCGEMGIDFWIWWEEGKLRGATAALINESCQLRTSKMRVNEWVLCCSFMLLF
jgi:hypothetical protein